MTNVTETQSREVARPLSVLVPLIKKDLEQGDEAAQAAGMEYYRAAGEKLIEAKSQLKHGEFRPWTKRHFNRSASQITRYMALVDVENVQARTFSSINAALKDTPYHTPNKPRPQAWHQPVKEALASIDMKQMNLRMAAVAREKERALERKLALQLIDIGYKALATKLHPDKGGSRDAMARLNTVRDRLRKQA
jgi:hypothetical protein